MVTPTHKQADSERLHEAISDDVIMMLYDDWSGIESDDFTVAKVDFYIMKDTAVFRASCTGVPPPFAVTPLTNS